MLRNQDKIENQDAQQEALFGVIDMQQNDTAILYDAVKAVFAVQNMAVSSDFMDVLTDELAATGIASAILADVKSLVGGQSSDKQAVEKRIQDVVLFQQNRLLQQAQMQAEQNSIEQDAIDDVMSPVIDNAPSVDETVVVEVVEMELEEDFIENEEDCTIPFSIAEAPVVDAVLAVAADDVQAEVIALSQLEAIADDAEYIVTQEQSKSHAIINQTQDHVVADAVIQDADVTADAMEAAAHNIDVAVSVVADVEQHDAAIVADVKNAAENVDELLVVKAPQENTVENIVKAVVVIEPQPQEQFFDVIAPVVMQENAENIVFDTSSEPSINIAQEIASDFEQQDAVQQYVDVLVDVAQNAEQVDVIADHGVAYKAQNNVANPVAMDAQDVQSPHMDDVQQHAEIVMDAKDQYAPIAAPQDVAIEAIADIDQIILPQIHASVVDLPVVDAPMHDDVPQVADPVIVMDVLPQFEAEIARVDLNNIAAEVVVAKDNVPANNAPQGDVSVSDVLAHDAQAAFAVMPQQEGKSVALIQDNVKDVITAPDVFLLQAEPIAAVENADWYGDILQAQMHSFYGSLVSYGGQDAVDDAPEYAQAAIQRPMKPMAA